MLDVVAERTTQAAGQLWQTLTLEQKQTVAQNLNSVWQEALSQCISVLTQNHNTLGIDGLGSVVKPVMPFPLIAVRFIFGHPSQLAGIKERWKSNLAIWGTTREHFYSLWPGAKVNQTNSNFEAECLNIFLPRSARMASVKKWMERKRTPQFHQCSFEDKDLLNALAKSGSSQTELLHDLKKYDEQRAGGDFHDLLYVGSIVALDGTELVDEAKICESLRRDLPYFLMLLHHKQCLLFPEFLWWLLDSSVTSENSSNRLTKAQKWMENP